MSEECFSKRKSSTIFEKKTNEINNVNVEISQKFSVSSILYLVFNANLLKICKQSKNNHFYRICKQRECVDV